MDQGLSVCREKASCHSTFCLAACLFSTDLPFFNFCVCVKNQWPMDSWTLLRSVKLCLSFANTNTAQNWFLCIYGDSLSQVARALPPHCVKAALAILLLKTISILIMSVNMCLGGGLCIRVQVPVEARGISCPRSVVPGCCELRSVDTSNQIQILCKSSAWC